MADNRVIVVTLAEQPSIVEGEGEEEEEGQKTKVARRVAKGEKEGAAAAGVHQCESPEAGKSVDKAGEETAGRKRNQRTKVRNLPMGLEAENYCQTLAYPPSLFAGSSAAKFSVLFSGATIGNAISLSLFQ